ncbi:thiamine phosphate synthase [Chryseobacterium gossypii]|uniref:thiamine phosphate synthase n=1 Tax=Chryseobacterium gossypii TaxID=3231602 RepID=UPI00352562F0
MIIAITPEEMITGETETINQMFQEGLDLLHIRKPLISKNGLEKFISGINASFHSRLVLHSHYDVGSNFNISRIHFREADRQSGLFRKYADNMIISTSVHSISTYNALGSEWEYSLISPVFPSISKKGYGKGTRILEDIRHRGHPDVGLIALGGINENNIHTALDAGADGVALLGAIWESDQPINVFKKCRMNALL